MDKFELIINAEIRQLDGVYGSMPGGLRINETVQLKSSGFLELTSILAKFHELAQTLKSGEK